MNSWKQKANGRISGRRTFQPAAETEYHLKICRLLRELGVPEHLTGHQYLVEAILLALDEPAYLRKITGRLYPDVAMRCRSTPARVERAMRHAIETAWTRCDMDTASCYFGNTVSPRKGKPVNSEFIARVSNAVRLGE